MNNYKLQSIYKSVLIIANIKLLTDPSQRPSLDREQHPGRRRLSSRFRDIAASTRQRLQTEKIATSATSGPNVVSISYTAFDISGDLQGVEQAGRIYKGELFYAIIYGASV